MNADADPTRSPPLTRADLGRPFVDAEKPERSWRIGIEAERFGVVADTGAPIQYEGEQGVLALFAHLASSEPWNEVREYDGGPVIALQHAGTSITLEPGGQVELSAPPFVDLFSVQSALDRHTERLKLAGGALGIRWLALGFHPMARQTDLPWVPKQRYPVMRDYLPKGGSGALDMMRRTATVQPNFDFSDARDALDKLVLSLKVAPWLNAWLANSPFVEGQLSGKLSQRGDVWLRMPRDRSGLIEKLWESSEPSYDDYIDWALDAGMFLFKRGGHIINNSGQPFRQFLEQGHQGHHATLADWQFHLNTVFPEARLKSTLELRCLDALPDQLTTGAAALMTGLLYDADVLKAATKLLTRFDYQAISALRPALVARGLDVKENGMDGFSLASELLGLAGAGLSRRAARYGLESELTLLEPLAELVQERTSPAKHLIRAFKESGGAQPLLRKIAL